MSQFYSTSKNASKFKADYLAFGSFYKSKLKPKAKKANLKCLNKLKKYLDNQL